MKSSKIKSAFVCILMFSSVQATAGGMSVRSQGTAAYTSNASKSATISPPLLSPQTSNVIFTMPGIVGNTLEITSRTLALSASGGDGNGLFNFTSDCEINNNILNLPAAVS